MTQKEKNILKKLQKLRAEVTKAIKEGEIKKSGVHKHKGKTRFKYFELKDFIPFVNEKMEQLGMTSVVNFYRNDEKKQATLTLFNTDDPTDSIYFDCPWTDAELRGGATKIQEQGASHTYLRRYLWTNALELTEKDPVEAQKQEKSPTQEKLEKRIEGIRNQDEVEKAREFIKQNEGISDNTKENLLSTLEAKEVDVALDENNNQEEDEN